MAIQYTSGQSDTQTVSANVTPREGRRRRARRRRLEEQQALLQRPGTAGLGAGPAGGYTMPITARLSQGRPAPGQRRGPGFLPEPSTIVQRHPNPRTVASSLRRDPPSYANYQFSGVDTMTDSDRFAKSTAWYEKGLGAFPMTQGEIKGLIDAGIMTYGKNEDMRYAVPTVTVNNRAWEQFLDDNFDYKNNKYVRKNKNLTINDTVRETIMYGGAKDGILSDLDIALINEDWKSGKRTRNPRSIGYTYESIPTKGEGASKRIDYTEMGQDYAKDAKKMLEYQQKITKKIGREGGSAIWSKILTGDFTAQDVASLRQYMYSPNGEYGAVQERFIDTYLLGRGAVNPAEQIFEESFERVADVAEANVAKRAKEQAAVNKQIADLRTKVFNADVPIDVQFETMIQTILEGKGNLITTGIIDSIMRQGAGTITNDPLVTGGKRYNPAQVRSFSEAQKGALIDAVLQADSMGLEIPRGLDPYLEPIVKELESKGYGATVQQKPGSDGFTSMDLVKRFLNITEATKKDEYGRDVPLSTPEQFFNISGQEVMNWAEPTLSSSWLSSSPVDDPSLGGYAGNIPKSLGRFGLGFMPGLYSLASDPMDALKAGLEYYQDTYTTWDGFKRTLYEDPLMPVLDALSLVSGIGIGIKGAQVASAAGRLNAARAAQGGTAGVRATTGRAPRPGASARDLNRAERIEFNKALVDWDNLPEAEKASVPRPLPGDFIGGGGLQASEIADLVNKRRGVSAGRDPFRAVVAPDIGDKGITGREYAALMRQVANGDAAAALRLGILLPGGTRGANSLAVPTKMDRAAAFFTPRYKYVTREDGNKVFEDKERGRAAMSETVEEGPQVVRLRMSGQPVARAMQRIFFSAQARGGQLSPRVANIPLIGFNYRFDKAASESDFTAAELIRREFAMTHAYQHGLEKLKLDDIEMQVLMDNLSGGMYAPNVYAAAIKNKLKDEAAGMSPETRQILEAELAYMTDEVRLTRYARTMEQLLDGKTKQAKKLRQAQRIMTIMLEKQNRLITATDSPVITEALLRAYAPITNAVRGLPHHIRAELADEIKNVGVLNPNFHFNEQLKTFAEDFVWDGDQGAFRIAKELEDPMNEVRTSMDYIAKNQSMRNGAGHPLLVVDEVIRDAAGKPMFVRARMMRLEGDINEGGTLERAPLIDDTPLTLPASAFVPTKKGNGIKMFKEDEVVTNAHVAIVNDLNKLYPNVRDFTDKVSDTSINGAETFESRRNRNIVVASGLMDYDFQVQIDAHRATLRRRANDAWLQYLDDSSIPMTVADFTKNKGSFVALKTHRFFDNEAAAREYAQRYDEFGAVEEGSVAEVTVGNRQMWRTSMSYVDTMKEAIREQKTRKRYGTEELERAHLMALRDVKNLNPNEIIMVVPRETYKKFAKTQRGIDRLINDTLLGRGIGTSLFKVLVLSMNPRFIPQNVIGSTMMVGMATPELFPQMMANMWQTAARRAKGRLSGEEAAIYSHHADDFAYLTRTMAHDFFDNAYYQDRQQSFLASMGDSRLAKYSIYGGYTVVFAFESNMRVALMREAAMRYPGFKPLMRSNVSREFAKRGAPDRGLESLSRFQATFEALSNPSSPLYDENFVHHVRYTADGVLGNYRDFTAWEKAIRNYLIPFYAWQRHSALFTKRLFQERPLTANAAYKIGQFGFEKVMAAGGIPEWMAESVLMPDALAEFLELDPERNNFLNLGTLGPFSSTTSAVLDIGSFFAGSSRIPAKGSLLDYMNPFIKAGLEQMSGTNLLTGAPLTEDERGSGYGERILSMFAGFPAIAQVVNTFKTDYDLNEGRGRKPEDIFENPEDMENSKLSIPEEKLTEKFKPWSKAGLWNAFSPVRAISLDPEAQVEQWRRDRKERGLPVPDKEEVKGVERYTRHLLEWKRKQEGLQAWLAQYEATYPEMAAIARRQLAKELRPMPSTYPIELYRRIMGGA